MREDFDPVVKRARFGRRRVTPHACVVDRRTHFRGFLAEAIGELGLVVHKCADAAAALAAHDGIPMDLVVIPLSVGGADVTETLCELAAAHFDGQVLLLGGGQSTGLDAAQRLGNELGLTMLAALGTPFRVEELAERVQPLRSRGDPPEAPVNVAEALENNWLELWYQPKIELGAQRMNGAEGLCRLRHPIWGVVLPASFIPPDDDPHMRRLSEFVVARAWSDRLFFAERGPVDIAINMPLAVLREAKFRDYLRSAAPCHPDLGNLLIEVNSAEVVQDIPFAEAVADYLHPHDIGFAIDDVGQEWPSLAGWSAAPLAEIKVDRALVQGCARDRRKRDACRGIISMAKRLGARTVAEGVEARSDLVAVRALGFDLVQGFLTSKPMEARKFARACLHARTADPRGE